MSNKICSPSRRDLLRGVAIGAGGCALGSMLIHPQEAMGQSIEGCLGKIPMETRWDITSGWYMFYTAKVFKTVYDEGGKEKYVEFMKDFGRGQQASYKAFADRFGFTGNDPKSAAAILPAIVVLAFGPRQKFEIEEATAEKVRVKCVNCEFWKTVQAAKITDDICSDWSRYTWEGRAKAINPKLTSTLVRARPRGDSVCEWAIELEA